VFRVSDYTIIIDLSEVETLLIHGYSGSWDIVSSDVAATLIEASKHQKKRTGFALQDKSFYPNGVPLDSLDCDVRGYLVKKGYLTNLTPPEEQHLVAQITSELHKQAKQDPPSYVFTLSYACNLSCSYCFQHSTRTNRPENVKRHMSQAMVDSFFSLIPVIDERHCIPPGAKGGQNRRRITLFGGEPLLGQFSSIADYVIQSAQNLGPVSIAAVTNGTELHKCADLLGPDKISFLQIPMDGGPQFHDKRRSLPGGLATFALIARNIDLALGRDVRVKVRVNTDHENVESFPILADIMEKRGWLDNPLFSAYAIPLHETSGSGYNSYGFGSWQLGNRLRELSNDYPLVARIAGPDAPWERKLIRQLGGNDDPLFHYQPCYCGAHIQTWVFDPFGDIYACWERAGQKDERIGKVSKNGDLILFEQMEQRWRSRTIVSNPICGKECPYALYCGGGCALLAELNNGYLHSHFCDDFDKRFRALAVRQIQSGQLNEYIQAARTINAVFNHKGGQHERKKRRIPTAN
jgi:uncharacterized protein